MKIPIGPRPCPVCGSENARDSVHRQRFIDGPLGDGYLVVICSHCGAGFSDGIPGQPEFDRHYAEQSKYTYDSAGGAESAYDFKRFAIIADQLEPHLSSKQARILDIGCATGGLLAVLKQRGYANIVGSDPSPACAAAAKNLHGIEVIVSPLHELDGAARSIVLAAGGLLGGASSDPGIFDAVLLVGVLEHLHDVRSAVHIAARLLRPGGILYCAQPDVESFAECVNAPYQQFSTEHVNFFSSASLSRLMSGCGLASRASWRWIVEWREGMTDSVVSGLFERAAETGKGRNARLASLPSLARDTITRGALDRYLAVCAVQQKRVERQIETLVQTSSPFLVWGAGTQTRRLLAETRLKEARITAFVDSNPHWKGTDLAGRPILLPEQVPGHTEAILISSIAFEQEIMATIRELGLKNPIMTLAR